MDERSSLVRDSIAPANPGAYFKHALERTRPGVGEAITAGGECTRLARLSQFLEELCKGH